jgi:hypothetical protein
VIEATLEDAGTHGWARATVTVGRDPRRFELERRDEIELPGVAERLAGVGERVTLYETRDRDARRDGLLA